MRVGRAGEEEGSGGRERGREKGRESRGGRGGKSCLPWLMCEAARES